MRNLLLALSVVTALPFAIAHAQPGPGGGSGHRRPHGPPPEAIAACTDKAAGAACSVTFGDRTLTGTCAAPPDGGTLACRPDGPPPGPPPGR